MTQVQLWLSIGAILLVAELVLGISGGFLFGIAIAALAMSLIVWIYEPASVWVSIGAFAGLSVILTWAYWKYFRGFNESTDAPGLHSRADNQVGTTVTLTETVGDAVTPHFIGDTRWRFVSETGNLAEGTQVVVTAKRDDGVLVVAARDTQAS